ncbi:uncharacterized protein LOC124358455 [Homalodisca vitripennis]|uniref:uncharacterized protein LOC124358455 n=1 Tax=Homalodisca vitripennis TaxID=197043 RepID=UPI001EEAE3B2|nr:uncharacterized protein LOC124358455 [Homalodisca vitripennis]
MCWKPRASNKKSRQDAAVHNVGSPFERIAIDIAGPFPVTDAGNKYLLVAMDYFTKWPEVYAIPNQEASTVAGCLVNDFVCRYGVPRELHSDQGTNFGSILMRDVLQRLGVHKTRTTPLHPQSDGMVERYIKTLQEWSSEENFGYQVISMFGLPPDKERPATDFASELVDQLHDTHEFCSPAPEGRQ